MDDALSKVQTLQANNQADATALSALENDLNTPATDSVGDQVLAAVLPVLTAAGYTVTAPAAPDEESTSEDVSSDDTETVVPTPV